MRPEYPGNASGLSARFISSAWMQQASQAPRTESDRKGGRLAGRTHDTDVFVVGGGPAGLATAIAARQKGFRVVVADGAAPSIDKPCGEGMMPETLAALRQLGVEFQPGEGQPFRGICFVQDGARVCADFPQGPGIGLRRPLLQQRLVAKAEECGVQLLWNTSVSCVGEGRLELSHGQLRARWIVGADGPGSRVRRWSGLEAAKRHQRRYASRRHYRIAPWSSYVEVHWGRYAQAYVTPVGRQEVCVVITVTAERVEHSNRAEHASFDAALDELPRLKQRLARAELSSRERGAVTAMHVLRKVQRGNVALVGDASGGVDAITGEGLRLAFLQAQALANAMAAGNLEPYQQAHRKIAQRPLLMGDLLLWLSRNPRIRSRAIQAMAGKPELFARLLATHVGSCNPVELLSAGALLGWRLLAV